MKYLLIGLLLVSKAYATELPIGCYVEYRNLPSSYACYKFPHGDVEFTHTDIIGATWYYGQAVGILAYQYGDILKKYKKLKRKLLKNNCK